MPKHPYVKRNAVCEWGYTSAQMHPDPFNEIEVDVVFSSPEEKVFKVPAYWAGGQEWRIRFAAPTAGTYTYESVCSDPSDQGLHGQSGTLTVGPDDGGNDLLAHGRLQVSASRRYLEHQDGTPFFWLADTWWMGLCQRLRWPEEFQLLTEDRVRKGFSVVQTVAGLYPDMPAFDERGANEAGFPWEKDYGKILPAYFDMADLRNQIATVPQDVFLFTGTIAENISLHDPRITLQAITYAAEQVYADRYIAKLPKRYDENILEEGKLLSVGQRQLLSFARAFVRNPSIVVLDEATSNIDSETEALIEAGVKNLLAERTAIIIAHRLSTIKSVDRILVLHKGELVEEGNHESLLQQAGLYQQLYEMQALMLN